ncbi:MAG: SMP-30/gluconolactonase/LRE family protein [Thermostichus sp. BF3_bins_97]
MPILQSRARLGEGPVWDPLRQCLFWVDIYNHRVHQFIPETGADRCWEVGEVVGSLALAAGERLLLAQRHRLAWLDLLTGAIEPLLELETDQPDNRCNDGKCDPQGRFWFGTMGPEGAGSLYRYDGHLKRMETGLTISNGLGWSPDGQKFYLTDSPRQQIYIYDFEPETGSLSNRRVFIDLRGSSFFPDGLTLDAQGCLWVALWDGWAVQRFDPQGIPVEKIEMPVQRPTCPTFGGLNGDQLFITTASVGLSEKEIQKGFHAGDLFVVQTAVQGLLTHRLMDNI